MSSFIVLGLIPGTNIQIGFWAYIAVLLVGVGIYFAVRYKLNRRYFDEMLAVHFPVEASQLHFRG